MRGNRMFFLLLAVLLAAGMVRTAGAGQDAGAAAVPEADRALARQLDEEARGLIVAGDFPAALKKLEAAEVMAPDPVRAARIERLRTFVQLRGPAPGPASAAPGAAAARGTEGTDAAAPPAERRMPPAPDGAPAEATAVAGEGHASPEGRVRAMVDGFFRELQAELATEEGMTLDYPRDYPVVPRGAGRYLATPSPLRLMVDGEPVAKLAPVEVEAGPVETHRIPFRVALPERFDLGAEGAPLAEVTIGGQRIEGIWNDRLGALDRFDLVLEALELRPLKEAGRIALGRLRMATEAKSSPDGRWSQEMSLSGADLQAVEGEGDGAEAVTLERFSVSGSMAGRDRARFLRLAERISDLGSRLERAGEEPARAELERELARATLELLPLVEGYQARMTLTGASIRRGDERMALGGMELGLGFRRTDGKQSELSLTTRLSGIRLPPSAGVPETYQPVGFGIDLKLAGLPEELLDLVRLAVEQGELTDEQAGRAQAALLASGARAEIRAVDLELADFALQLAGTVRLDAQSPWMTTGALDITLVNLPALQRMVREMEASEELLRTLTRLSLVSERRKEGDRILDHYRLRWGRDGTFLLNGRDATLLFGEGQQETGKEKG